MKSSKGTSNWHLWLCHASWTIINDNVKTQSNKKKKKKSNMIDALHLIIYLLKVMWTWCQGSFKSQLCRKLFPLWFLFHCRRLSARIIMLINGNSCFSSPWNHSHWHIIIQSVPTKPLLFIMCSTLHACNAAAVYAHISAVGSTAYP